ncbi:hypothetical protein WICPIJ_005461 [Wickerhamomyces pijperi]|uniref:tRNA ligase kinase domain-containing protein n=1 Tax=Wickerhamomyces pijperi TaxID=599730 RepID=A0A9P8Q5M9_WICPI|nr:hypothetical protein WICPIJ_005461 [Wickerhamomyces pijperi]
MSRPPVPPSNDKNKRNNMSNKPFVLRPIRYVIIPISFVNSGKQTITHALKSILPNVAVANGHSVSNEKFYKSLSRVLDNDKVQVVIAHRNNTSAGDHKIYEALRGYRDKYELKFIAVQFVQKYELFSDSFMNRLLNDIIINEEMSKEDLSLIARGPGKIREIVNATRSRFQDITNSEKPYYPLIVNLQYKDDKFFEYLKTILQNIHETFPVLLPAMLPDEDIAKYTYEADTKEEANARDFYSNGAANLKKYELDPEGEFGDSPNTSSHTSLNQIREPQSLPVLPSPQLKQQGKPTKFVIIQCSTLGTGKEQITQILMESLLAKPALIESGNQTTLFKDLSRAFIRHSTVVISANNHRYFHRNMIVSVLKRFHTNYNVHTICLDYINDLDYDTFDFFQRSTNNILSLEFHQPSTSSHLKTLTITDTEAFMIPRSHYLLGLYQRLGLRHFRLLPEID